MRVAVNAMSPRRPGRTWRVPFSPSPHPRKRRNRNADGDFHVITKLEPGGPFRSEDRERRTGISIYRRGGRGYGIPSGWSDGTVFHRHDRVKLA